MEFIRTAAGRARDRVKLKEVVHYSEGHIGRGYNVCNEDESHLPGEYTV